MLAAAAAVLQQQPMPAVQHRSERGQLCAFSSVLYRLVHILVIPNLAPAMCSAPLNPMAHHQVVITSWQPELPTYADFEQRRSDLWQRPAWARGVLVDDRAAQGGPPLHVKMQHVCACPSIALLVVS